MIVVDVQILEKCTVDISPDGFPTPLPSSPADRTSTTLHCKDVFKVLEGGTVRSSDIRASLLKPALLVPVIILSNPFVLAGCATKLAIGRACLKCAASPAIVPPPQLLRGLEIICSGLCTIGIIIEKTDSAIASVTEKTAHLSRCVVVIDVEVLEKTILVA